MSFRNKLQYFLVKKLQISNSEAQKLLFERKITVNGKSTSANILIEPEFEIRYENEILQLSKNFKYLAFNKPRGIETTLNSEISDNLISILPFEGLFPVGRLDKASEGLLILTDDGRIYDKILRNEHKTEKEYIVKVDKTIDRSFLDNMAIGVKIMGKTTLPCQLELINENCFKITLIQGLNRQIRRMCYKLGYEVISLKRTRIGNLRLEDLGVGEWRHFEIKDVLTHLSSSILMEK
ncbi:pseudouridine synthase [Lacihabitans sp. CCS-44]|uniref:pseudouridine synthase n=1 Tax=Lacihabitans sp. CCS-44 TaxID=2487331 RepID=UPI0020CBFA62|nr:pseudouridine synthase [Lacihabitans sp. CCS-44]MCP9756801.1 pseudouridine synthase [Lacihabitans sp. CCS-44]